MNQGSVFAPVWRQVELELPGAGKRVYRIRRMTYGELLRFSVDTNAVEACIQDAEGRQLFGEGGTTGIRLTEADSDLAAPLVDEVCKPRPTQPQ